MTELLKKITPKHQLLIFFFLIGFSVGVIYESFFGGLLLFSILGACVVLGELIHKTF